MPFKERQPKNAPEMPKMGRLPACGLAGPGNEVAVTHPELQPQGEGTCPKRRFEESS